MTTQSQAEALAAEIKRLAVQMCAESEAATLVKMVAAIDRLRDLAASAAQGEAVGGKWKYELDEGDYLTVSCPDCGMQVTKALDK